MTRCRDPSLWFIECSQSHFLGPTGVHEKHCFAHLEATRWDHARHMFLQLGIYTIFEHPDVKDLIGVLQGYFKVSQPWHSVTLL